VQQVSLIYTNADYCHHDYCHHTAISGFINRREWKRFFDLLAADDPACPDPPPARTTRIEPAMKQLALNDGYSTITKPPKE
jgi:hypothetical protein